MNIHVEFPEELLVASREDPLVFTRKVMIYTLGHLYEEGKISSGIGAQVLGCDRLEFYRLLSEHGFSVIHYTAEELEEEVRTSRKIAARVQRSWINDTDQPRPQFVVCINNAEYPASLELYKIYRVLPDEDAARDGDIRVIDESGEDYLYPAAYFVRIEVPQEVERAMLHAS